MTPPSDNQPKRLGSYRDQHKDDVTKGNGFSLNPLIIRVEPGFNVREEDTDEFKGYIESLTQAYINDHFVPPIIVSMRDGEPTVVDGHCRLQAILNAIERGKEIERVPVVEYHGDNELDRQLMLVTANAGRSLSPTEEARVYHRLHNTQGYTVEEIAEHVGKSVLQISARLDLHQLPSKLKQYINAGRISASLATKLFREHGTEAVTMVEETVKKMDEAVAKAEKMGKKVDKAPKVTERKLPGRMKLKPEDNRLVQKTLSGLADRLIEDQSRVSYVKSQDRFDVSFSREEFIEFADMMQRIRKYTLDAKKAEAEERGERISDEELGPNTLGEEAQEHLFATMR